MALVNSGPSAAYDVQAVFTLPTDLTFKSVPSSCSAPVINVSPLWRCKTHVQGDGDAETTCTTALVYEGLFGEVDLVVIVPSSKTTGVYFISSEVVGQESSGVVGMGLKGSNYMLNGVSKLLRVWPVCLNSLECDRLRVWPGCLNSLECDRSV